MTINIIRTILEKVPKWRGVRMPPSKLSRMEALFGRMGYCCISGYTGRGSEMTDKIQHHYVAITTKEY